MRAFCICWLPSGFSQRSCLIDSFPSWMMLKLILKSWLLSWGIPYQELEGTTHEVPVAVVWSISPRKAIEASRKKIPIEEIIIGRNGVVKNNKKHLNPKCGPIKAVPVEHRSCFILYFWPLNLPQYILSSSLILPPDTLWKTFYLIIPRIVFKIRLRGRYRFDIKFVHSTFSTLER